VDTLPRDEAPASEEPPYRLPSPLVQPGPGLPVAPSAPRIPRALRAFNGMPPAPAEPPRAAPPVGRGVPQRTIRDLLLDAPPPVEESALRAGLRSAWRRLRGPGVDPGEDGDRD
jgi:hypothetical protein